ncbi:ABC transporter substrate-binding protein [Phycisphaerae bacterium]|jgi:putative ABC transport system permease protein|nr:ABC transporter substrate-binding protein [Phycisphaerae bacterium]
MTFLLETIRLGLTSLRLHLLRSILTALGIILGVASVIVMSSLGEGSTREALAQIEALGARNIIIRSQKPPETQNQQQGNRAGWITRFGLTRQDFENIQFQFPDAEYIVPVKSIGSQILRNEKRITSQAFGTTPQLRNVANLGVDRGRYLSEADMDERALVCVIGAKVAENFFPLEDPLGQTLRIDQKIFTVIGVLRPVGFAGGAGASMVGRDLNQDVHVPLTTARETFGDTTSRRTAGSFDNQEVQVSEVFVSARTRGEVLTIAERLQRVLETRRSGLTDVGLFVPYELLETARKQALQYQLVFGSIAGIALLVGGIGIMNIMLASVTERTREIGIRRALGATRKHIQYQFLVETSVLSTTGGIIGVILGIGFSLGLGKLVDVLPTLPMIGSFFPPDAKAPTAVTLGSIIISFTVAVATGLIFGIYPARKAAKQDPIVALRHD